MKLCSALSASLALLAPLGAAAAEGGSFSRVALLLPACEPPGLGASELRDAVRLELQTEGLALAPAGEFSPDTDALVRIDTSCLPTSELTLFAELGDERQERRLDLDELPPAQRARAVSLSLAELLAAFAGDAVPAPEGSRTAADASVAAAVLSGSPSSAHPSPLAAAAGAQPSGPHSAAHAADDPATPQGDGWLLGLAPELRLFESTWLWGARARMRRRAWSVSADALATSTRVTAGQVTTLLVHLGASYDFLVLGRPERWLLQAGPRVGAGATIFKTSAEPTARGASAADAYFDVALGARCSVSAGRQLRLGIGAELGYARGPVGYADGAELARTFGPFASMLLDAGWQL